MTSQYKIKLIKTWWRI